MSKYWCFFFLLIFLPINVKEERYINGEKTKED